MEVRSIEKNDLESIKGLSAQMGYSYAPEAELLKTLMESENDRIYVAVDPSSRKVTGFIHVQIYRTLLFDPALNILGIAVDEKARGKGTGSLLLEKAEEFGRSAGCAGIRANSGAERLEAHEFYRRRGFDSEKNQKRFFRLFNKQ